VRTPEQISNDVLEELAALKALITEPILRSKKFNIIHRKLWKQDLEKLLAFEQPKIIIGVHGGMIPRWTALRGEGDNNLS